MDPDKEVKIPSKEELLNLTEESVEEGTQETQQAEVSELNEVEQEAAAQGWTTKEAWVAAGKDPKQWRSADVWLDRGEFFRAIRERDAKIENLSKQVSEAYKVGQKIAEGQFKKELDILRARKEQALEEGDASTAIRIQDLIEEKQETAKAELPSKEVPKAFTPPPEYNLFTQRNPWYLSNTTLQYTADAVGIKYKQQNPEATPADIYFFVETEMYKEFPKLNPKNAASKLPPMDGGSQGSSKSNVTRSNDLSSLKKNMSEMDLSIMRTLIRNNDFPNEEAYLKQYAEALKR